MNNGGSGGYLILFLGADWWGSDARALAVALRQQGHCLIEVQYEDYFPLNWSSVPLKAVRRLIRPLCVSNYNQALRQHLANPAIDFLLVFKGNGFSPATLKAFRERKVASYCLYPDVSFASHGANITECLPHYDAVFTTKEFHLRDEKLRATLQDIKLVRHGFDPEVHRLAGVSERVRQQYACDVSFVGCWSPKKERLVNILITDLPAADVRLWGPGWERATEAVRRCWAGRGAYGDESVLVYEASKINLGLLSEASTDTLSGDQTTVRTWQVPAAGGFLLHEETAELGQYLTPGKEVATFKDKSDLSQRVQHYLRQPTERAMIAAAGQQRCVKGGYTYHAAARAICSYHKSRSAK